MTRRIVAAACIASLAIGLLFIFVWAPHPWGWEGFDEYHTLALTVARGEPFPTIDRPWGYAYFLAAFYRLFGDRPVIPLVVQAGLNALLPLLVFQFARTDFDERVGAVAALLTGLFCFNTVYASTQASDAICTVLFMAAVVLVARARRSGDRAVPYASAGLLLGLATQFRPNLILAPVAIALCLVWERRARPRVLGAALVVVMAAIALVPWTVRNERLTGEPLPTSTHGGMQLWYGTLQTREYLDSRSYNPRSAFELGSLPYTSLDRVPLVVTGRLAACAAKGVTPTLVYWTDRDARHRSSPFVTDNGELRAEMAPQPAPTAYYFYAATAANAPPPRPSVFFVSDDHLGDMDRHGDLLDVFDIVRIVRHIAWAEPMAFADRLDLDGDGTVGEADLRRAVDALLAHAATTRRHEGDGRVDRADGSATLRLADGSSLAVPRTWSGRVTDLEVRGELAEELLHSSVAFAALRQREDGCQPVADVAVNAVYYRAEPQAMRRYLTLAIDNIRRDPSGFAASVAFRAVRVFFIEGSNDPHTAYQFSGSGRIYAAARTLSIVFLVLFAGGVVAAARRGAAIALPLVLIAYIPATLAFVLTNMRYSITVQPLMFVFVAALFVSVWEQSTSAHRRADIGTARLP